MISKERLEELIKKGATIYEVKYHNINEVKLDKDLIVVVNDRYIHFRPYYGEKYQFHKYLDKLFESKEEAEWHKEFGNITRTETLKLPTWEEFRNEFGFDFFAKSEIRIYVMNHFFDNEIYITDQWGYSEKFEYTKEGYLLVCRKCKKLFLGEEE